MFSKRLEMAHWVTYSISNFSEISHYFTSVTDFALESKEVEA